MKKISIFPLLLLLVPLFSSGQDNGIETIEAWTDRTLYISGETINFSVFLDSDRDEKIFYCELIDPLGKSISGRKFKLEDQYGTGCIVIPEDIITGCYYLKFYTRFMRNFGPEHYKYHALKIINPDKEDFFSGNDSVSEKKSNEDSDIKIEGLKNAYRTGEKINFSLGNDDTTSRFIVSFIPQYSFTNSGPVRPVSNNPVSARTTFRPESAGVSLTGRVIRKGSGEAVPNLPVYLSFPSEHDIFFSRSDPSGRFYFSFPDNIEGTGEIFICAGSSKDSTLEVIADNDFCTLPVHLPSPVFRLTDDERTVALKMAVNTRMTEASADSEADNAGIPADTISFYGTPSEVLVPDKYVDLNDLSEYFDEVSATVKIRKINGRKKFLLINAPSDTYLYEPLVLVNWIPFDDPVRINSILLRDIKWIDVINQPYIKGDFTFGGIISIITKSNDFAGIRLPVNGQFLDYQFITNCEDKIHSSVSPYTGNTIFRDPGLKPGNKRIEFAAPSVPGNYVLKINCLKRSGEVISEEVILKINGS